MSVDENARKLARTMTKLSTTTLQAINTVNLLQHPSNDRRKLREKTQIIPPSELLADVKQLKRQLEKQRFIYLQKISQLDREDDCCFEDMVKAIEKIRQESEYNGLAHKAKKMIEQIQFSYASQKMRIFEEQAALENRWDYQQNRIKYKFKQLAQEYSSIYEANYSKPYQRTIAAHQEESLQFLLPFSLLNAEIEEQSKSKSKQADSDTACQGLYRLMCKVLQHKGRKVQVGIQNKCRICLDKRPQMLNQQCGHLLMCLDCYKRCRDLTLTSSSDGKMQCPFCRQTGQYINLRFRQTRI